MSIVGEDSGWCSMSGFRHNGLIRLCLVAALFAAPGRLPAQAPPSSRGQDFYSLNDLGDWKFRRGDFRGALAAYRQAYELNPQSPYVLENLGDTHKALGESRSAVEAFAEAIRLLDMDPHGGTRAQQRRLHEKMIHYLESQPDLLREFTGPNAPPFGKSLRAYEKELSRLMEQREQRQQVEVESDRLKATVDAEQSGADERMRDLERVAREHQIQEELAELRMRLAETALPIDRRERERERRRRLQSALGEEESARMRAEDQAELERERWRREIDEQDRREEEIRMRRLSEALSERRSRSQDLHERMRLEQLQEERDAAAERLRGLADEEAHLREAERRLAEGHGSPPPGRGAPAPRSGRGRSEADDAGQIALAEEEQRRAEEEVRNLRAEADAAKQAAEEAEQRRAEAEEEERAAAEAEAQKTREEAAQKIMAAAEAEERLRLAEEARAHAEQVAEENRKLRSQPIGAPSEDAPGGYPYADREPHPSSGRGTGRVIIQGEPPTRDHPPPGVCPDDPRLGELEALRRRRDELLRRLEGEQSSEDARRAEEESLLGGRGEPPLAGGVCKGEVPGEGTAVPEPNPCEAEADRNAEAEALAAGRGSRRSSPPPSYWPDDSSSFPAGLREDERLRIPPPPEGGPGCGCDDRTGRSPGADLIELTDDTAAREPSGGSIDACLRAIEMDPKNWEVWERLGDAYRLQGYRIDAQYAYERAISLRGKHDERLEAKYLRVKR